MLRIKYPKADFILGHPELFYFYQCQNYFLVQECLYGRVLSLVKTIIRFILIDQCNKNIFQVFLVKQKCTEEIKLVREQYHKYKTTEDVDSTKTIMTKIFLLQFYFYQCDNYSLVQVPQYETFILQRVLVSQSIIISKDIYKIYHQ